MSQPEDMIEMAEPISDAWVVSDTAFPRTAGPTDQLRFLVNYAVLAPSTHNTQPWLFKVGGEKLELYADRTRSLAVADPEDRELTGKCNHSEVTWAQALGSQCLALSMARNLLVRSLP